MSELFLKETTKDDAKYKFSDEIGLSGVGNFTDKTITVMNGYLQEINQPKIVDLSGLVGNTEILFEFSDDGEDWFEGYLCAFSPRDNFPFMQGHKLNSEVCGHDCSFMNIRFASRWYFHDGKSGCVLPEGIGFEAQCTRIVNGSTNIYSDNNKRDRQCWIHAPHLVKVIAYRPTGLIPGYVMPGGE